MEKDKQKIKIEGVMQLPDMICVLEQIIAEMKTGVIAVQVGDESLALHPSLLVNVATKVSKTKDAELFDLELSWKRRREIEGFTAKSR